MIVRCALPPNAGRGGSAVLNGNDIYRLVVATFSELGMPSPISVCETFFVTDGFFIGHKYHCGGRYAMWGEAGIRSSSMTRAESC